MPIPIPNAYVVTLAITPPANGQATKPTVYGQFTLSREMLTEASDPSECSVLTLNATWLKLIQDGAIPELCK